MESPARLIVAPLLAVALLLGAGCGGGGSTGPGDPVEFDVGDNDRSVVVAFGDGIAAGVGSTGGAGFRGELQRLLAAAGRGGLRVVDEGVPGSTSAQGAARIGEVLRRRRPAALLLLYGEADEALTILQPPLDHPEPPLADSLRAIIEAARANRTLVLVSTLPPVCAPAPIYRRERTAAANLEVRALARETSAGDLGVVLVDAWGDFLRESPADGCGLVGATGTLPSDAGYATLAASFAGGLSSLAW